MEFFTYFTTNPPFCQTLVQSFIFQGTTSAHVHATFDTLAIFSAPLQTLGEVSAAAQVQSLVSERVQAAGKQTLRHFIGQKCNIQHKEERSDPRGPKKTDSEADSLQKMTIVMNQKPVAAAAGLQAD